MFEKTIKIINSPFQPNLEVVDNFVVQLFVPYSEKLVTVQISPNITHYEEKGVNSTPDIQIAQVIETQSIPETQTITLDFDKNNICEFKALNKKYTIKLLAIGKKNIENQDFPTFEFYIQEI